MRKSPICAPVIVVNDEPFVSQCKIEEISFCMIANSYRIETRSRDDPIATSTGTQSDCITAAIT